jgi:hypothetical protein
MSQSWNRCCGSICATPHLVLHDTYNTCQRPLEATQPAAFYPDRAFETRARSLT